MSFLQERPPTARPKQSKKHQPTKAQIAAALAFASACVVAMGLVYIEILRGNHLRPNLGVVGVILAIVLILIAVDQMETYRKRRHRNKRNRW